MDEHQPLRSPTGRLTLIFLVVVGVGLTIGWQMRAPAETGIVGMVAPEVVIEAFDGSTWVLSTHLSSDGRPVVLNLWASWCEPCREEIPELTAFAADNPGVVVVGAAVEDRPQAAAALAEELAPGYLVGMDATGRLLESYPSFGMPVTVYIDGGGIVRARIEGGVTQRQLERTIG